MCCGGYCCIVVADFLRCALYLIGEAVAVCCVFLEIYSTNKPGPGVAFMSANCRWAMGKRNKPQPASWKRKRRFGRGTAQRSGLLRSPASQKFSQSANSYHLCVPYLFYRFTWPCEFCLLCDITLASASTALDSPSACSVLCVPKSV